MRGYACIGLDNPKSHLNVGAVLRAAHVYGAAMVAASGRRYDRSPTDTMCAYRHMPLLCIENILDVIPFDCVPVAVDLVDGALDLREYKHPERAFYIFGAEDATLGRRILERCRDAVFVPTRSCMNLAATVNVILYDRLLKTTTPGGSEE